MSTADGNQSTSILQSFKKTLPQSDQQSSSDLVLRYSSTTAEATDCPKVLVQGHHRIWTKPADESLKKMSRSWITKTFLPFIYPNLHFQTEGDVVLYSALYFLHPVHLALSCHFPDHKFTMFSESLDDKSNEYGPRESPHIRCDLIWSVDTTEQGWVSFAALEFKKRGAIKQDEFRRTAVPVKNLDRSIERAHRMAESDRFPGNSLPIMKQVTTYALKYGTKYVACFDWDQLVLFDFEEYNGGDHVGDWARYSIASETDSDNAVFRKMLLGFLIEALEHKVKTLKNSAVIPLRSEEG